MLIFLRVKTKVLQPLNNYIFDLKAEVIHLSFVKNVWKKNLLAHNYADHELLKKHFFSFVCI